MRQDVVVEFKLNYQLVKCWIIIKFGYEVDVIKTNLIGFFSGSFGQKSTSMRGIF